MKEENQTIIRALNKYGKVPQQYELLNEIDRLETIIDELEKKVEQLENIRKEAIEYINKNWGHWCSNHYEHATETINILNKGDNK